MKQVEVVAVQEFREDARIQVPGVRNADVFLQLAFVLGQKGRRIFRARIIPALYPQPPGRLRLHRLFWRMRSMSRIVM